MLITPAQFLSCQGRWLNNSLSNIISSFLLSYYLGNNKNGFFKRLISLLKVSNYVKSLTFTTELSFNSGLFFPGDYSIYLISITHRFTHGSIY